VGSPILRAVLLGLVQGLTEFLPISSSGHLVLAEKMLGESEPDLYMQVFLHFGTLIALLVVYGRRLAGLFGSCGRAVAARMREGDTQNLLFVAYLAVGTVPAMVAGYAMRNVMDRFFSSVYGVGAFMLVTGTVVFLTRFARAKRRGPGFLDSVAVGLAQAFALLPGISRSGITIGAGMFRGVDRGDAADFSFMLAIPSILIVSIYDFCHLSEIGTESLLQYAVGMISALVVGYAAVRWLLSVVKRGRFHNFSFYCWSVGVLSMLFWAIRTRGGY
jgi:undecaprenyl-diphosphatase